MLDTFLKMLRPCISRRLLTELTFKTAIEEALYSGGHHKQLSRKENLAKSEF